MSSHVDDMNDKSEQDSRIAFGAKRAAYYLDCSENNIRKYIQTGELPSFKLDGKRLILREDLIAFLKKKAGESANAEGLTAQPMAPEAALGEPKFNPYQ